MPAATTRHRVPAQPATDYDVMIVGAGSAGLSAALVLGRCLRPVLVCDGGAPRNRPSPAVQGFLTRDGTHPEELIRLGREQLAPYKSVEVREARVTNIEVFKRYFRLTLEGSTGHTTTYTTRKVLLATGVDDELPPLDGMRDLWGRGVLHCPYCHGWEVRNKPLAVYGRHKSVTGLALLVSRWSSDVIVCTDGWGGLSPNARRRLRRQGIALKEDEMMCLEGTQEGDLQHLVFKSGEKLARQAVFIHAHQHQRSPLAEQLGCRFTEKGAIVIDKDQQSSVPGVYAAGDITPGTQQALLAAAKGSQAAICINETLTREECPR
ncbi:NAD(P)/FAD-dependent oxidoreductase [Hymenobacter mucosus]|uniref:Thioredoxin reductase n=1 Tax=Hymenobacter mucosus TaxID=1411120 RepID=A0A238WYA4_9BACT|nr:NAD(P)/FAD-dependent oxidoreductase [Hymenobacter mucosus]SNR51440.1 Thioredoxin reductase [Hymenobacter mucosus]